MHSVSPACTQVCPQNAREEVKMRCPFCRGSDSRVLDSRTTDDGAAIRRRRHCPGCDRRFTTQETALLSVLKRSGASESFRRDKVISGVRKACQGRPVSDDDLALLAQSGPPVQQRCPPMKWAGPFSGHYGSSTRSPTCASLRYTETSIAWMILRPRSVHCVTISSTQAPSTSPATSPPFQ